MSKRSISFAAGVTLVGGADFAADDLTQARDLAPHIVAADRGADTLASLGVVPDAIIGDMDSMRGDVPEGTTLLRVAEQETTDFDKCLAHIDAPFVIGIGFMGGRLDHTLAVLHGLMVHRGAPVLLLGDKDVIFAAPPVWSMEMVHGTRVSFYPVMPCRGVSSQGLRWPIDGLAFAAGAQIGTSNEATGGPVSAGFDGKGIVTILPKSCLKPALASLGIL